MAVIELVEPLAEQVVAEATGATKRAAKEKAAAAAPAAPSRSRRSTRPSRRPSTREETVEAVEAEDDRRGGRGRGRGRGRRGGDRRPTRPRPRTRPEHHARRPRARRPAGDGGLVRLPTDARTAAEPGVRLRLDLGLRRHRLPGWARQPGLRTVQGELEAALSRAAPRSRAGAHRLRRAHRRRRPRPRPGGPRRRPGATCGSRRVARADGPVRRLAGVLPDDVRRARRCARRPPGFDARFSAPVAHATPTASATRPAALDPLLRSHVLHHTGCAADRSTSTAMNAAAAAAARRARLRRVLPAPRGRDARCARCSTCAGSARPTAVWRVMWIARGRVLPLDGRARSSAPSLPVGDGRRPVTWPAEILAGTRREPDCRRRAVPLGLSLEHVAYPPDDRPRGVQAQRARRGSAAPDARLSRDRPAPAASRLSRVPRLAGGLAAIEGGAACASWWHWAGTPAEARRADDGREPAGQRPRRVPRRWRPSRSSTSW